MAEVDPTFEQQVFDISQRQRKPHIHHHDQADDLGRGVEIAKGIKWFSGAWHARCYRSVADRASRCICFDSAFKPSEPSGKSQRSALSTIRRLLNASSDTGQAGCAPQTRCLKVEDAISEVAATLTAVETNKRRNRARTLVRGLTEGGYLQSVIDGSGEAWLWQ